MLDYILTGGYPPPAFYFKVEFLASGGMFDTSFKEVSGISFEMKTQEVEEGGENRFVHKLPNGVKHSNLVLKRGVEDLTSPLVLWCQDVLDDGFQNGIETRTVMVKLLDADQTPIRNWSFSDAYPVKWEIGGFDSQKNEVAIETIELAYTSVLRL